MKNLLDFFYGIYWWEVIYGSDYLCKNSNHCYTCNSSKMMPKVRFKTSIFKLFFDVFS